MFRKCLSFAVIIVLVYTLIPCSVEGRRLCFVGDMNGWILGSAQVFHSADGGVTWRTQAIPGNCSLEAIDFVDEKTGWALGANGVILHTQNGGLNWFPQNSGVSLNLTDVDFVNKTSGWAVGIGGTVLSTADAGQTWQAHELGMSYDFTAICMVDATIGWIVGDAGIVLHTADGGSEWQLQSISGRRGIWAGQLFDVDFVDKQTGWLASESGIIFHTGDGGQTWQRQATGTGAHLYSVDFITKDVGCAVGEAGAVLWTHDGGKTWVPPASDVRYNLKTVWLIDKKKAWATEHAGMGLFRAISTRDGGMNWTQHRLSPRRPRPPRPPGRRPMAQPRAPLLNLPEGAYVTWKPMGEPSKPELAGLKVDMAAYEKKKEAGYFAARLSSEVDLDDVKLISPDGEMYLIHPVEANLRVRPPLRVDSPAPLVFLGRFSGKPERVTIQGKVRLEPFSVTFGGAMRAMIVPSLAKEWAKARIEALAEMMTKHGRNDFCVHEILRLAGKYGLDAQRWRHQRFWRRTEFTELEDIFAVATGAAAIEESLQIETLRQVQESVVAEQVVPITSLVGPEIKSHPYEKMLGDSTSQVEKIAALVPFDSMYARFASVDAAYQFLDFLNVWGADILRMRNLTNDGDRIVRRVEEQLCIQFDRGLEPFVSLVVSEIAIVFGDPYVHESVDISLIFHLKNRVLFETTANMWFKTARTQHKSLQEEQTTSGDVSIRSLVTDDGKVASHSAYIGDYVVYSNNLPALKNILDVRAGEIRSLAEMGDFKYMRSIFRRTEEDGFIYMGDDFVRKVVGAKDKIKEMRRVTCREHMLRLEDARQAYRMENNREANLSGLFTERFLTPFPACPNGGTYQLTDDGLLSCSVHGRRDALRQLSILSIEKITPKEKELYEGFKSRYHSYFTEYFDPIGIQIRVGEEITMRTCILPLIQNSVYRSLGEVAGGAPIAFDHARSFPADAVIGVFLKLRIFDNYRNDLSHISDEELRQTVSSFKQEAERETQWDFQQDILSWIGNELIIGTYDTLPSIIGSEIFVLVELKDRELTQKVIDRLLETTLSDRTQAVIPLEHKGYTIKMVQTNFAVSFAVGLTENLLILGSNDKVVRRLIDMSTSGAEGKWNFLLHLNLQDSQILKKFIESQSARLIQHQCRKNRSALEATIELFQRDLKIPTGQEALANISRINRLPYCPEGGEYLHSPEKGIACSIHGSNRSPKYVNALPEESRLRKLFEDVDQITASLEFTKYGIMTTLRLDNPVYAPGTGSIFKRLWQK